MACDHTPRAEGVKSLTIHYGPDDMALFLTKEQAYEIARQLQHLFMEPLPIEALVTEEVAA
ncbi:MAG TPA: hypothetical protein VFO46_02245 [Candidatus Sulfotelmatobacter sp.]|nr:hypothetical protein [Candidatus Sulfotelmatobacter sp.]